MHTAADEKVHHSASCIYGQYLSFNALYKIYRWNGRTYDSSLSFGFLSSPVSVINKHGLSPILYTPTQIMERIYLLSSSIRGVCMNGPPFQHWQHNKWYRSVYDVARLRFWTDLLRSRRWKCFHSNSSYIHKENAMDISTEFVKFVACVRLSMGWHETGLTWDATTALLLWKIATKRNRTIIFLPRINAMQFRMVAFQFVFRGFVVGPYTFLQEVTAKMIRNIDWSVGNFLGVEIMKVRNEKKLVSEFYGVEWCDTVAAADLDLWLPKNCRPRGQLFLLQSTFFDRVSGGLRYSQIFHVDFWRLVTSSGQPMTLSFGEVQVSVAYQFCEDKFEWHSVFRRQMIEKKDPKTRGETKKAVCLLTLFTLFHSLVHFCE